VNVERHGKIRVAAGATAAMEWNALPDVAMRPSERAVAPEPVDFAAADDRALVDLFREGRREAFDEIVRRHQRNVYRLCYRFAANHEDAADLTQDAFVRAFRGLARFKNEAALGTWLHRVAVNVCLNRAASKRPETEPIEKVDRTDVGAISPFDALAGRETADNVRRAIRQLPPRQRATLVLRVYEELPHEEIARLLGGTAGAAKANFFHALGNLRRLLGS
jgi:RNA polymerase sigma-70 factor, ECF subfamily